MLTLRFRNGWIVLSFILVAAALFFCLAPAGTPVVDKLFELNDKVEHAVGYAALTIWFTGLYPRGKYIWIVVGLFALGIVVELVQGWMAMGRNKDFYDVVANSVGIAVGLSLALVATGGWVQRVDALLANREPKR